MTVTSRTIVLSLSLLAGFTTSVFAAFDIDTVRNTVNVSSMATFTNPSFSSVIYAQADSSTYFSANNGDAWQACTGLPSMRNISQDKLYAGNGYLFAITGTGVYRAAIGTNTWQFMFDETAYGSGKFDHRVIGTTGNSVFVIKSDTVAKNILILKSSSPDGTPIGVFSIGWEASYGTKVTSILSDTSGVYVDTDAGYTLTTKDGSNTWVLKYSPSTGTSDTAYSFNVLAISGSTLIGAKGAMIFRSVKQTGTNQTSWSIAQKVADSVQILALIPTDGKLFAGTTKGLYVSSDTGTTWSKVSDPLISQIAVSGIGACSNGLMCGTVQRGIFKSVDGGKSFLMDTNGVPAYSETYREYITAIPKKGERRRYLTISSANHWTYSGNLDTSTDIVIIDSVATINRDTTLLYIRVIDTTKGSSWSYGSVNIDTSHYEKYMVITITGFQYPSNAFSGIPYGLFGRFLKIDSDAVFSSKTMFEGKDALTYHSPISFSSVLVADSIGFVSLHASTSSSSSSSLNITLIDDSVNPNSTLPQNPSTLRKSSGITFTKSIGRVPRKDVFTLNGRKGSWHTGTYGMVIEKRVSGVDKNKKHSNYSGF